MTFSQYIIFLNIQVLLLSLKMLTIYLLKKLNYLSCAICSVGFSLQFHTYGIICHVYLPQTFFPQNQRYLI